MSEYFLAMDFAAFAHGEQKFPGKQYSYIVHIAEVAAETMNIIFREEVSNPTLSIQCAILHDTLEDTNITYEEVLNKFGLEVANGVKALTKNLSLEKNLQMQDSLDRLKLEPKEVQLVKLADRITNLQEPPNYWTKEKIKQYNDEAKLIYETLKSSSKYGSNRLKQKIEEYKKYE
ncbi:MAG: HD domain-containing protein [Leptospiraceae bacterium]|nr:HD domain-containing protein [Leptospiraceae bacterium]